MRTTLSIASVLAIVLASFVAAPPAKANVDVSFGFFYSDLSPHGSWLVSAQYGRVWQPAVYRPGWNPYYDGHWECADVGWTWVSDYGWGDIPYHYGTWVLDPRWGWVWVPGYTWAPSWVVFRTGPDYIGWAPVPPRFTIGASFTFGSDPDLFLFVRAGDFLSPRIRARVVPHRYYRTAIRRTTFVNRIGVENHIVVNRGPDIRFVERATRRNIRPEPIERIHRALPRGHASRHDLRADRGGHARRLRAADPVPRGTPDPGHARGRRDHERHESPAMRPDHGQDRRGPRAQRGDRSRPQPQPRMQRQERGTRDRRQPHAERGERSRSQQDARVQRQERAQRGDRNRSQRDAHAQRQERGSRDRGNAKGDRGKDKKKDSGKGKGKGRR